MTRPGSDDEQPSMRSVRVHRLGSIVDGRIERIPVPEVRPDEVLVEVHAVGVNYVDLLTMEDRYQFRLDTPYTPGKGPAGVVRDVGSNVDELSIGDRVLAMAESGGFAEAVVVDRRQVHLMPSSMGFAEAASMAVAFDTAWVALRDRARLSPGDSVLVLGATGAVGGAAIQLARAMGASTVLAGLASPGRLADAGLDDLVDGFVDLGRAPLRDTIREEVFELTAGRGVDVIIDPIGGDALDGAIRSLAWRGRYVVVGFASGRIATLATNYLLLKNVDISGLQISDYRKRMPELVDQAFREIFDLFEAGRVRPPPFRVMRLDEWSTALHLIKERSADRRIVLDPLSLTGRRSGSGGGT
jgi:NADPH2:quinone reductase